MTSLLLPVIACHHCRSVTAKAGVAAASANSVATPSMKPRTGMVFLLVIPPRAYREALSRLAFGDDEPVTPVTHCRARTECDGRGKSRNGSGIRLLELAQDLVSAP